MSETPKDSPRRKRRLDGDGSLYQRHKKDCERPTDKRGKSTCKCTWVGAVVTEVRGRKVQRKRVSAPTRAAAANKVRELKEQIHSHELPADGKAPTVEQWMNYWYTRILPRTAKPYTLAGYNAKVNQYIIPLLGHHRLDRLTPEHIEDAWDRLREEGNPTKADPTPLAPNTIHQTHRILARALKVAVQRKRLRLNPAGASMMDAPPRIEQPIVLIPDEHVDRIMEAARGQWNAARWNVALAMGLRQGEALGLRWEDVDLDAGELHVRQTLMRVTSKGIVFGVPKSEKSRRDLSIPPSLLDGLKAHRKAQNEQRLAAGSAWTDSGLVFTYVDGRPMDPSVDAGRWRALLQRAGVPHYRLHDARHHAGAMMVSQGVDIRVAMRFLGHSQLSVTMRYQHVVDEVMKDAAAKLDQAGRWA